MNLTPEQFQELLLEQQEAIKQIYALSDDYTKSNKERRAKVEYAKALKNNLENHYNTLTLNHLVLKDYDDKSSEYYTKNCYESTNERYQRTLKMIDEHMPPTTSARTPKEQQKKEQITKLVRKHAANTQIVRSTIARIMADTYETVEEIDYAINNLQVKIDDIAILHGEIYSIADLAEVEGYNFNAYNQLECDVSKIIQTLIRKKSEFKSKLNQSNANEKSIWSSDLVKLPKLTVPEFDGRRIKWPNFRNNFVDMVHNATIPESYKFQILKTKLVGHAEGMISEINSHKDSYEAAWQRVMDKYDNKKAIVFEVYETLFNQEAVAENNASALDEFVDTSREMLSILSVYDVTFENSESVILFLLLQKLDSNTQMTYELKRTDPKALPALEEFFVFLELRSQALQACRKANKKSNSTSHVTAGAESGSVKNGKCICCNGDMHKLRDCQKFKGMTVLDRRVFVKEKRLCFNCLRTGHLVTNCDWSGCPIRGCTAKHNSMLHLSGGIKEKQQNPTPLKEFIPSSNGWSKDNQSNPSSANDFTPSLNGGIKDKQPISLAVNGTGNAGTGSFSGNSSQVFFQTNNTNCQANASSKTEDDNFIFLGTAMIYIDDNHNNKILCRALLDSGSQVNIMTRDLWKKLGLKATFCKSTLDGIGSNSIATSSRVSFMFTSNNLKFKQQVEALVLPKITSYLPAESIDLPTTITNNYNLADPKFNRPESIDVLLGAEICMDIFQNHKVSLGDGLPLMKETELGWVVMGKYTRPRKSSNLVCSITTEEIKFQMMAPTLWELEDNDKTKLTVEEEMAELHFKNTTFRNSDGKFVVSLPKYSDMSLGQSFSIASQRFKYLEKRFAKDSNLFVDYKKFLDEYISMGHMKEISFENISKIHCFLPHHPVLKESSTTTKLRVVFDASSKTNNNVSLNDLLLKGPIIQDNLFSILLKFRLHPFAICADIEKMYRQILVNENDQDLQVIIWRNSPSESFKFYKLQTVTYGTTSAPFLATRCLKELADQNSEKYPKASTVIGNSFYVDDLVTGFDCLEEAKQVQSDIITIMESAGFHLRKWSSNHPELIENLPSSDTEMELSFKNNIESIKTLGVMWNPSSDILRLSIPSLEDCSIFTKRTISAESGQIYDPLGIVNPCVVIAKLLIQKLWILKIDWDEPLPQDIIDTWMKFRSQISTLKEVSVNRFITLRNSTSVQLHGFADASKQAYGAVIYIRSVDDKGNISVNLLCSKSKISPISNTKAKKKLKSKDIDDRSSCTIPKLELSAAKLLAELVLKVKNTLSIAFDATFLWSDSNIVLSWLTKNPSSFTRFVSNRIATIQELTNIHDWRHIPGEQNPADIISRGMFPKEIVNSSIWFNGPTFLQDIDEKWSKPNKFEDFNISNDIVNSLTIAKTDNYDFFNDVNHRNSFKCLVHIFVYVNRFIENLKSNIKEGTKIKNVQINKIKPFLAAELSYSEIQIFKVLQNQFKMRKEISKSYKNLSPFIDNENVIRVGGRLRQSNLSFETKHPILLPFCLITILLVKQIHWENLHVAPQGLLSITRQKYWPVNGLRICTRIFQQCIICFKSRPRDIHQLMGQLPASRVSPMAPFSYTGVDFAGPFTVHYCIRGKRPTKVYLALFVCFTIKAVHLELVSDLSTPAFIAAFKRFISRRGRPIHMYSDNATNFVGAKNELKELHEFFQQHSDELFNFAAEKGVQWETIPARSPHFGGLWEAGVKRAKFHLTRILANAKLTYEELNTVIIEIEYILNSRPLTAIPNSANDLCALTPNHFLMSGNYCGLDEKDIRDKPDYALKRYQAITKIRQEFWSRFTKEYLTSLQKKTKWLDEVQNLKVDMPVLMKDTCLYPLRWKMGLIEKVYTGSDNLVRVVDVKTNNGIFRRAITQIAPFPTQKDLKENWNFDNYENNDSETFENNKTNLVAIYESVPRAHCQQSKSPIFSFLLTIFYFFFILSSTLATNPLISTLPIHTNITRFSHHPGIYFDGISKVNIVENRWHIVTYFNLSDHFNQFVNFSSMLNSIRPLCKVQYCQSTITQLEHRLEDIERMNELIRNECQLKEIIKTNLLSRSKRSAIFPQLNVLGNIANSLTGVLDHSYAEKMEKVLANIKQNEDRTMALMKNHTTVIENTVNVMKENNIAIVKKFDQLNFELKLMRSMQDDTLRRTYFNSMTNYLTLAIMKYREIQLQLHITLTQFKGGKLNAILIDPQEIQNHLMNIQNSLMKYKLPSTSFAELESVAQVAVTHGTSCLLFHIELPLVNNEDFNLYRMIPVPTFKNGKFVFINPVVDYLAVNAQSDLYYLMSTSEFQECTNFVNLIMCYEHQPIYTTTTDNHCEVNLFLHDYHLTDMCNVQFGFYPQYWIELSQENQWLYSVKELTTIKTICPNHNNRIEVQELHGEGIIEVPEGCSLNINGAKIYGKRSLFSDLVLEKVPSVLPFINISAEIPKSKTTGPMILKLNEMSSVVQAIQNIKAQESITLAPIEPISDGADIHTWITYGLFLLFLTVGISFYVIRKCCPQKIVIQQTKFDLPEGFGEV